MAGTSRDWMERAACADHPELDWFDLDCYLQATLAICAVCPVADDCLAYAKAQGIVEGLWGGEWGHTLLKTVGRPKAGEEW